MKFLVSAVVALMVSSAPLFTSDASAQRFASIADYVSTSGGEFDNDRFDYDILLNAVVTADLVDALSDSESRLTLFAPNDFAMMRLANDLGFTGSGEEEAWNFLVATLTDLGGGDPIPVLTDLLLYHVAPERLSFWRVLLRGFFRTPIDTLQGGQIRPVLFKLKDNEPALRNPRIFFPSNIRAGRSFVHTIDRVLIHVDLP